MRQQQGIARPKIRDLPKAANKDGLKDKKEDGMDDSMEELPESFSGRSKFERTNKFKSKENEEVKKENDEEEACMLECGEGIGQISREVYEEEEDDGMTDIEEEIDLETERRRRRGTSSLYRHIRNGNENRRNRSFGRP
ncbi:hypothetical protein Adt_03538 [Abeliophyllum distichum]|uniref:Uncharacterized protein n=1 Tax=Abeliophyllum distichum TaxID=126358 RepID=A0ABD1VZ66_9LAMI